MSSGSDDATTPYSDHARLRLPSVELVVVDGPSRGVRVLVTSGSARVGTAPGNALRLDDPTVSRVHLEIEVGADAVTVRDCGSSNGTWIEGARVRDADVGPGAILRLGRSVIRVESGAEPSFFELSDAASFGELVGASVAMRRLYAMLARVAPTDTTVLLQGETGTGKDVVARELHRASKRATGPFVPIDCGAIPEALFESELFGHVRGAFSHAVADRRGVFEEAQGGTLFLDEIAEMPLDLQAKLLRAIETRSVRRVGSNEERRVDVRLVAATNRSLTRAVNEGTFREDLYYRLAVVEVTLAPLRSRREDIPLIARKLLAAMPGGDPPTRALEQWLKTRPWPGNVRELRNFLERSVALGFATNYPEVKEEPPKLPAGAEAIVPLHLPLKEARQTWIDGFEHIYVRAMLAKTQGNVTRAAELAGVTRRFLQRMLARMGLRSGEGDDGDPPAS